MLFLATVEAQGYGDPEAEGARLLDAVPESDSDLQTRVQVDDERGLLMVRMRFDAHDAMDASEQAAATWQQAWEQAFEGADAPMIFRLTARPATADDDETFATVSAGSSADPLADLDEEDDGD